MGVRSVPTTPCRRVVASTDGCSGANLATWQPTTRSTHAAVPLQPVSGWLAARTEARPCEPCYYYCPMSTPPHSQAATKLLLTAWPGHPRAVRYKVLLQQALSPATVCYTAKRTNTLMGHPRHLHRWAQAVQSTLPCPQPKLNHARRSAGSKDKFPCYSTPPCVA